MEVPAVGRGWMVLKAQQSYKAGGSSSPRVTLVLLLRKTKCLLHTQETKHMQAFSILIARMKKYGAPNGNAL